MRDADIDDSDIPRLDKSFWKTAKLTMAEPKDRLTIRVDHDVVEWLKKAGSGYQTRINAILRSYMKAQSARSQGVRRMGHPAEAYMQCRCQGQDGREHNPGHELKQ